MTLAGAGKLKDVPPELVALTKDQNEEIAATSAEALCHAGMADQGLKVLLALVQNQETMHVAASALEEMGHLAAPIEPQLMEMKQKMPIRSILISLGKLPFEEYYGKKMIKQGIEANGKRMAWQYPSPDPAVNMKRPKEEQAAD
jgi:hypothetical protein